MKELLDRIIMRKGTHCQYVNLPVGAKKAIIHYQYIEGMGDCNGELESYVNELGGTHIDGEINWDLLIKIFDVQYEDYAYYHYEMPTEDLTEFLMSQECDFAEDHTSFQEYHEWYASGYVPEHGDDDRWYCMAGSDDEGIWDGWHRFHSYYRSGHKTIPLFI